MTTASSTGSLPPTGYKLYMYPGIGMNTIANPQTVFQEVQLVQTSILNQLFEIQEVYIPMDTTTYSIALNGVQGAANLNRGKSINDLKAYIDALCAQTVKYTTATVTVGNLVNVPGNMAKYRVTFTGFDGPVEMLVLNVNPNNSTDAVISIQKGTEKVKGSFTLSYNGSMTVDMPFDVSDLLMKSALEDLPGVGFVDVTRTAVGTRDAFAWTVTFQSAAGDLPMLYATPGRLTPLSSKVDIKVTEVLSGSDAVLVYDGTGIPEVRT